MPPTYQIKPGDTLSGIASKYGLNWRDLASINNLSDPNRIRAGSTLKISGQRTTTQSMPQSTVSGIPTPTQRTAFDQVLPYEKVFNKNLITGLAESQINPEMERQFRQGMMQLTSDLAGSGAYRTGRGSSSLQSLTDATERQRKEQVGSFVSQIGDYTTDWYNQQKESYYKNPTGFVAPTLPSYEQFSQQNPALANAYNNQTNIPINYQNPFKF